eukprot:15151-Heterococcus_DN1.PRE.1
MLARDGYVFTAVFKTIVVVSSKQATVNSSGDVKTSVVNSENHSEWQQVYRGICEDSASLKRMAGSVLSRHAWHPAAFNGNTELVSFLIEQGTDWLQQLWQQVPAADAFSDVSCWALPALQYAVAAGCPLGPWRIGLCDELITQLR